MGPVIFTRQFNIEIASYPFRNASKCITVSNDYNSFCLLRCQAGASRCQFDSSVFMNGDEWERLGRLQRHKLQALQRSSCETPSSPSSVCKSPHSIASSPASRSAAEQSKTCSPTTRDRDVIDASRDVRSKFVSKTTLNALLDMDKVALGGATVDKFVSSVREPETAAADAGDNDDRRLPPLTAMMHLLSVQQTSSYRPPKVASLRRPSMRSRRAVQSKKKISTLAMTISRHDRRLLQ